MEEYNEECAWKGRSSDSLWMLDKLLLSKHMGYVCGPCGVPVPRLGSYIVRPCVNPKGMGEGAFFAWLEGSTDKLPAGYFWCEIFKGRHLSIDYIKGEPILVVEGFKRRGIKYWSRWEKRDIAEALPIPDVLKKEKGLVNAEFIGDKLIEVHFRGNPDFKWGNVVALPVWKGESIVPPFGHRFVEAPDGERLGFFIK